MRRSSSEALALNAAGGIAMMMSVLLIFYLVPVHKW